MDKPIRTESNDPTILSPDQACIRTLPDGTLNLTMPSSLVEFGDSMVLLAAIFQRLHSERGFARYCLDWFANHPEDAVLYGINIQPVKQAEPEKPDAEPLQ